MVPQFAFFASMLLFLASAPLNASPTPSTPSTGLEKRFKTLKDQWDNENISGRFILYNNLWNKDKAARGGFQRTEATGYWYDGDRRTNVLAWQTQYNWNGNPREVKTYANAALTVGLRKSISAINSILTRWDWEYTAASGGLTANVAYDLWLSGSPNGEPHSKTSTFEIMIWISNRNAGPTGTQVATPNVGNKAWRLYQGQVENWTVYSFIPPAGVEITGYEADLKLFLSA
ncbi:putative effector protein/endo-beta-1,4-glucanase A [Ceratobasidium theobromae]|uniref:Putative effector protein/endo-beta-1,4-glucanase A n=1 Tax=Ceratobasidium theobromae TaxID=1582974 RepID=A0A5N5QGA1_9AGAM|nr:putative effector protein/endo-beta-1,4-glucanase A [Ceratobasidium theobromae]